MGGVPLLGCGQLSSLCLVMGLIKDCGHWAQVLIDFSVLCDLNDGNGLMSTLLGDSWDCIADFLCCHGSVTGPVAPTHTRRMEDHPPGLPSGQGTQDTGILEPRFRGWWPQWGWEEERPGDHLHLGPQCSGGGRTGDLGAPLGCI